MKKLATLLAILVLLSTLFSVITLSSSADGEAITGGYGYYYNQNGKPVMDFMDSADNAQIGVWWWWGEDEKKGLEDDALDNIPAREKYLNFFEENGVNEIYFYGYYLLQQKSQRLRFHNFVSEANRRGIVVSIIYDDNDTIMSYGSALDDVCDEYLNYLSEFPDDVLGGIHFDVEHETEQKFASKLVSQFPDARKRGVPISMDVNCEMNVGVEVSAGGVTGNIYEVIAANVDTLTLMSYKDSYEKIWALGANAFAAAKKYGCRVVFAVETGDYSSGAAPHFDTFNSPSDEFAQEDKEYLYGELAKIYDSLKTDHPEGGFGVAVHQHEDWYNLKQSSVPISTAGSDKTERQTVSHASVSEEPTQSTKKTPRTPLKETVLWSGDVNQEVIVGQDDDYVGYLSGDVADAINAAIRADLAENGTISDDEYYEITTEGFAIGRSGYATTGFMVNGDQQLWTEGKVAGTQLIGDSKGTFTQKMFGTTEDKNGKLITPLMNDTTEFVYFSDARFYTDTVTVDSLTIKVYRHEPYTGTETETETEPTTTESSATESSATESSATEPSATEPSATEPSVTEPSATESSATESSATESSATESSATEPSATESSATESSATEPSATEPSVTEPSVTEPAATETRVDDVLLGDANDDGKVNMKDVLAMRKCLADLISIDDINLFNADVNGDLAVNMKDVLKVRQFLANLISHF